jgi:hypothetical protein
MLAGVLSMLPPYIGPVLGLGLDVRGTVEVVDHVLPGVVVALCGGLMAHSARRDRGTQPSLASLTLCSTAFLAGLFQTATHVPLLFYAGEPATPWAAVLLHGTLAPVITVIALWLTATSLTAVFPSSTDPGVSRRQRQRR